MRRLPASGLRAADRFPLVPGAVLGSAALPTEEGPLAGFPPNEPEDGPVDGAVGEVYWAALDEWIARRSVVDWTGRVLDVPVAQLPWTPERWRCVVAQTTAAPTLLALLVRALSPFWRAQLRAAWAGANVPPLDQTDHPTWRATTEESSEALWRACRASHAWWALWSWPRAAEHLLFLSDDPTWADALSFLWMDTSDPASWADVRRRAWAFAHRVPPTTVSKTSSDPPPAPPDDRSSPESWTLWAGADPLPMSSCAMKQVRDVLERACLDRTGVLERLLRYPSVQAVYLENKRLLIDRAARLELMRVLETLRAAGLITADVVASAAVTALTNGNAQVWAWVRAQDEDHRRAAAAEVVRLSWMSPGAADQVRAAHWVRDWATDEAPLFAPLWSVWTEQMSGALLLVHPDVTAYTHACDALLELSGWGWDQLLRVLLVHSNPLGFPRARRSGTEALGMVLDHWPSEDVPALRLRLTAQEWRALLFHPAVQRVVLQEAVEDTGDDGRASGRGGGGRRM